MVIWCSGTILASGVSLLYDRGIARDSGSNPDIALIFSFFSQAFTFGTGEVAVCELEI